MSTNGYSADEMMAVEAARRLDNATVCFVGIGLPSLAANLARRTHAPGCVLVYESGTIGAKSSQLPLSIGDGELAETADAVVSVPDKRRGERIVLVTTAEAADGIQRTGLTTWNPGTLAKVVQRRRGGYPVTAYPALVDERDSVAVRVFSTAAEQAREMWAGTRRLLLIEVPTPIPLLSRRLSNQVKLGLTRYPYSNVPDLLEDCVMAALDAVIERAGGPAWQATIANT